MLAIGVFGPTASGKSDVAAAVCELIPAEVVSADAMPGYDGLPILTNHSSHAERLVGSWPLTHAASVGEYAPLAHAAVDEILAAGRTPLVVGGTGRLVDLVTGSLDDLGIASTGAAAATEGVFENLEDRAPVQLERGFVIHSPVGAWEATLKLAPDLGVTSSRDVLDAIARGAGPGRPEQGFS